MPKLLGLYALLPAGAARAISKGLIERKEAMPNVYVEARPKGRIDGSPITDYVVEDHADHVLATFNNQHDAAQWAKSQGHAPLIARVRELSDKKKRDHWRSA
jgi:hypothetical protein